MKIFPIILCLALSYSVSAKSLYKIESIDSKGYLTLSLTLTDNQYKHRELNLRGSDWSELVQVTSPLCDSVPLEKNKQNNWILPEQCQQIRWQVIPKKIHDGEFDVSAQLTFQLANEHWILFSEQTSLYRLIEEHENSALLAANPAVALIGATAGSNNSWVIPPTNHAPEFYIVGQIPSTMKTEKIGPLHVNYIFDDETRVQQLGLTAMHEKSLDYLLQILPSIDHLPANERSLLIIWIGIDEKYRQLGGAAGNRSFLANYMFGDTQSTPLNNARSLLVMAHEQFHQLVEMVRGDAFESSTWIDESLAQYYGLKALNTILPGKDAESIWARFLQPQDNITQKLADIERQFLSGNSELYPLFSTQGVTFWVSLDKILQEESNGNYNLDMLLIHLLTEKPASLGQLPLNVEQEIIKIGGKRASALIETYIR